MIGLALEGGGVRGSYQAGVYAAMLECGIKFDGICGTSIGAMNAAYIASGQGENLANVWRKLNVGEVFGFSKKFVEVVNKREIRLSTFKTVTKELAHILTNKGIELNGMKDFIDKYLDIEALINSDIDFGLVTVRLKDLQPMYLWKNDMNPDKIKDYIVASCFLPIFKMEKLIDDNYYLDGGFYDTSPVNMLLNKGYQKVYLIKLHAFGMVRPYDKDANVVIIEPSRNIGTVLDLEENRIDENIAMGYFDGIRVLRNYDGIKYVFKPKSEKYFKYLNRKISEKKYRRVKNFFGAKSFKETTIKALEYVMERECITYYDIYEIKKVIKKLKRIKKKNHFVYDYVKSLKYIV